MTTLVLALGLSLILHSGLLFVGAHYVFHVGRADSRATLKLTLRLPSANGAPAQRIASAAADSRSGSIPVPRSSSGSLTQPAMLLDGINPDLEWPNGTPTSGRLTMRILIDLHGRVVRIDVMKSNLPREIEGEIVKRFYLANYKPGELNGRPIASEIVIEADMHR